MPAPGGKKRLLGSLEFMMQFQGISKSMSSLESVSQKIQEISDATFRVSEGGGAIWETVANLADANAELSAGLTQSEIHWWNIRDAVFSIYDGQKGLDGLSERQIKQMVAYGNLLANQVRQLKEMDESSYSEDDLKLLEDRLELFRQLVPEEQLITKEAELFSQKLVKIKEYGESAFKGIANAISGVKDVQKDVTEGFKMIQELFSSSKEEKGGGRFAGTKAALQRMFFGDSDERKLVDGMKKTIDMFGKTGSKTAQTTKQVSKLGQASQAATRGGLSGMAQMFGRLGPLMSRAGGVMRAAIGPMLAAFSNPITAAAVIAIGIAIGALVTALAAAVLGFKFLIRAVKISIEDMEALRLVNYRALGSIKELREASYEAGIATGLSTEQTIEAIKAISHAGITSDELTRSFGNNKEALKTLIMSQGNFSRITGVSAESIAVLNKRLIVSGVSGEKMQHITDKMTLSMAAFGITGKDAEQVIGTINTGLMEMSGIFNEAQIDNYVDSMLGLAAAAKRAGVEMSVVKEIDNDLRGLKGAATTLAILGGHFDELRKTGTLSVEQLADGMENFLKGKEDVEPAILRNMIDGLGVSANMQAMLMDEIDMRKDLRAYLVKQGWSEEALNKEYKRRLELIKTNRQQEQDAEKARQDAIKEFNKSTSTITQTFQTVFSTAQQHAMKALAPLIEDVSKWLAENKDELITVVKGAIDIAVKVGQVAWKILKPLLPVLGAIISALGVFLNVVNSIIGVIVPALGFIISPLWTFLDVVNEILDTIFGSSFLHLKEGISEVSPFFDVLKTAVEMLLSPIKLVAEAFKSLWNLGKTVFGGLGQMLKGIGEFFGIGVGEKKIPIKGEFSPEEMKALDLIKGEFSPEEMKALDLMRPIGASNRPIAVQKELLERMQIEPSNTQSSPIYTAKFDEEAKRSQDERIKDMINLQQETVNVLNKILEKYDPNNARTADALERIATQGDGPEEPITPRSRKGFGENIVHWSKNR